jgi:nucleoside-diphosphate-sugar epimerase
MPETKRVIVTGGAGFIGSHAVRRLVGEGCSVSLFIKETTNTSRLTDILPEIAVHREDLLDRARMEKTVAEIRPTGVFHFAASNIQSGVISSSDDVIRTNITGTVNLIDALSPFDLDFYIQTGSFLEYGMKKEALRETDLPLPSDLYAISKLSATLYGQAEARRTQKPILTFRLFTPYGPNIQKGRLVHTVIKNALQNEPIDLTHPSITRDFVFVEDIVDLCFEAMNRAKEFSGEIFNLGSGTTTTLETLVNEVLQITGSKSKVNWGAFHSVAYDDSEWRADMTKTLSSFTWKPKTPLREGLTKTINWFVQHEKN